MNVYPSWISEFQTGIYPDWLYAYTSGLSVQLDVFFALLSPYALASLAAATTLAAFSTPSALFDRVTSAGLDLLLSGASAGFSVSEGAATVGLTGPVTRETDFTQG